MGMGDYAVDVSSDYVSQFCLISLTTRTRARRHRLFLRRLQDSAQYIGLRCSVLSGVQYSDVVFGYFLSHFSKLGLRLSTITPKTA